MEVDKKINNKRTEYLKNYNKKYYEENKTYWKIHIDCECGGKYTVANKAHHSSSKRHMAMIKKQLSIETQKLENYELLKDLLSKIIN